MSKKSLLIIISLLLLLAFMSWVSLNKALKVVAPVINNEIAEKPDLIRVTNPKQNQIIQSPLVISGEARGTWFFEASFPVKLFDANGNILTATPAQAKAEWMTTDFVPFEATLTFQAPTTSSGVLVLEKDNPSGLPERADELRIPVRFQ